MVDLVKRETRAVKYKTGDLDFFGKIDLKEMLKELAPKHDQEIEVIIFKK